MTNKLQVFFDIPTQDASELHKNLNIKTRYDMWFGRLVEKYGFIEGEDFCTILCESIGGRRASKHHITIGMAKEICMIDNTIIGRKVRKLYIALEEECKKQQLNRLVGIETRKTLTDKIKESGENERMHGFAYSTYTKLAYNLCGIEYQKTKDFRSTLNAEQLKRVSTVEKLIDGLMAMGKQYADIKDCLGNIVNFNVGGIHTIKPPSGKPEVQIEGITDLPCL